MLLLFIYSKGHCFFFIYLPLLLLLFHPTSSSKPFPDFSHLTIFFYTSFPWCKPTPMPSVEKKK